MFKDRTFCIILQNGKSFNILNRNFIGNVFLDVIYTK